MKINKQKLKNIIVEEIGANFLPGQSGPLASAPNSYLPLKNYGPSGKPPEVTPKQNFQGRPPYETIGTEIFTEAGEQYITVGRIKYRLVFDSDDLTSGRVMPVGEYKFVLENGMVKWMSETPTHVMYDSSLEQQIMEYSGHKDQK